MRSRIFKRFDSYKLVLILILILSFSLRFYAFFERGIFSSADEAGATLTALNLLSFSEFRNIVHYFGFVFSIFYGFMAPLLIAIGVGIASILHINITEKAAFFPITLIGSFVPFVAYFLVKELSDKRAALIAAAFIAVWPEHIALSKIISGSELVGPTLLVLAVFMCIIYFKGSGISPFFVSIVLAAYIGSENQILGFFPLLLFLAFIYTKQNLHLLINRLINWRLWIFPILVLIPFVIIEIYFFYLGKPFSGFLLRFLTRRGEWGFYLFDLIIFLKQNCGWVLLVFFLLGIIYGVFRLLKLEEDSILVIWLIIFATPWIFLVSFRDTLVRAYLSQMTFPLIFLLSIALSKIKLKIGNFKAGYILAFFIFISTFAVSMNYVFDAKLWQAKISDVDPRLIGYPYGTGPKGPNLGFKTMGYYVRENIGLEGNIFTDIRPQITRYYMHRELFAIYNESVEDKLRYFLAVKKRTSFVILQNQYLPNFKPYLEEFKLVAEIKTGNQTMLSIFSRGKQDFEVLQTEVYDPLFDKKFGNIKSLYWDKIW